MKVSCTPKLNTQIRKGVKKYKLISKEKANDSGIAQTTISGFGNTNAVSFSLFSCSVRGNNEGAVEVSASPQTPAFVDVAKTITLTPDLGGIYVNWKNIYNTPVYIVLNYYAASDSKKAGTFKFQIQYTLRRIRNHLFRRKAEQTACFRYFRLFGI